MTDSATSALSRPLYGASFGQAVSRFFKKYATVAGRASRSEYWWVVLFLFLTNLVLGALLALVLVTTGKVTETGVYGTGPEVLVYAIWGLVVLAVIVPSIVLVIRRLHDGNFSGWLYLLSLIPWVGSFIVFILTLLPSKAEGARFDA